MTNLDPNILRLQRSLLTRLRTDRLLGIAAIPWRPQASTAVPATASGRSIPEANARVASETRVITEKGAAVRVPPLKRLLGGQPARQRLQELDAEVADCQLCKLAGTRTHAVPGEGNVDADLMFIGEGPGADEDRSGRPFVGRAGELLTKIIDAMGFSRETVFIANIVKCRPPGNRDPRQDESTACFPYLERQIELIAPKVICTLGLPATRRLLDISCGISAVRGKKLLFRGIAVVPTYHPAYLLRSPSAKPKVWKDVQFIASLVKELGGTIPHAGALDQMEQG